MSQVEEYIVFCELRLKQVVRKKKESWVNVVTALISPVISNFLNLQKQVMGGSWWSALVASQVVIVSSWAVVVG